MSATFDVFDHYPFYIIDEDSRMNPFENRGNDGDQDVLGLVTSPKERVNSDSLHSRVLVYKKLIHSGNNK